jgi:succinoglycan biosynthesis protein ExoA
MVIDVSVVIPCRNEGGRILAVLDDLRVQQGLEGPWEVVVADGSDDGTRGMLDAYAQRQDLPFSLAVVDNPARIIPAALNRAVATASGSWIVRIDGHSRLAPGYVATMLANLRSAGVDVAGGQVYWVPPGPGLAQRVIPWSLNTRLGNGGTPSRNPLAGPRRVWHTPLSCYRRAVWERLGGYDERLLTNEDFDFDWRATQAGFAAWSFPSPVYLAIGRGDLRSLWLQRWRYGYWKAQVARLHPRSLSPRQLLPLAALPAVAALLLATAVGALPWWLSVGGLTLFAAVVSGMVLAARGSALLSRRLECARHEVPAASAIAVAALLVTHLVWAAGAWWGALRPHPGLRLDRPDAQR